MRLIEAFKNAPKLEWAIILMLIFQSHLFVKTIEVKKAKPKPQMVVPSVVKVKPPTVPDILPSGASIRARAIGCPSPALLRQQAVIIERFSEDLILESCIKTDQVASVVLVRDNGRHALVRINGNTMYFQTKELGWSMPNEK